MTQFQLEGRDAPTYQSLDDFTQGYIEALFFTEAEPGTSRNERADENGNVYPEWESRASEGKQKDMPGDYGFDDLTPETLVEIIADCKKFQNINHDLLWKAYDMDLPNSSYTEECAGRDFWFNRNGHGVGFWDRGLGDVGEALSNACGWQTEFSETDAYLGDDEKVYLS